MFGPPLSAGLGHMSVMTPTGMSPLPSPSLYGAYGQININGINSPVFPNAPYGAYPLYGQNGKVSDGSQSHSLSGRNMQKRSSDGEGMQSNTLTVGDVSNDGLVNRFANVKLESLVNEIYGLCKDQHGCRYLQKKLEEQNPQYVEMIFKETHAHVVELMTGMHILVHE
jgi:hypothetical protein